MKNWQDWIVVIIVALSFGYVAYRMYKFILRTKKNENPCDTCATGCSLRDMVQDKMDGNTCCSATSEKKDADKVGRKK